MEPSRNSVFPDVLKALLYVAAAFFVAVNIGNLVDKASRMLIRDETRELRHQVDVLEARVATLEGSK